MRRPSPSALARALVGVLLLVQGGLACTIDEDCGPCQTCNTQASPAYCHQIGDCCVTDGDCGGCGSVCTDNKCGEALDCNHDPCLTCDMGTCTNTCGPGIGNDPEITGFDGKTRWFTEVGDFTILKEHGGMEIAATFASEKPPPGYNMKKEYSWTQTVRVTSPEGDVLVCHLPSVLDPARIQVTATSSAGNRFDIAKVSSDATQTVRFESMYVKGVVKNGQLVGCQARSERLNVYVVQMFGPVEAANDLSGKHAFAKPFTWLNMAFQAPKPLKVPVTGLIGRTYPLNRASTRRLMAHGDAEPEVTVAGLTGLQGEALAELLLE